MGPLMPLIMLSIFFFGKLFRDFKDVHKLYYFCEVDKGFWVISYILYFKYCYKVAVLRIKQKIYILLKASHFMGKLNTIYQALLNRNKKIVRREYIIALIEEYNKKFKKVSIKNALWYLSRRNYLKRIFLDYYYINSFEERARKICNFKDNELLFEVLNLEKIKWYLGLNSALKELGETWQGINAPTIINDRISGKKKVAGMNVNFIKIKPDLIFGLLENKTKNKVIYFYSDVEKTRLDLAYFRRINNLIKNNKTKEYIRKYPKWIQKLI
jgi:hypothetical protein